MVLDPDLQIALRALQGAGSWGPAPLGAVLGGVLFQPHLVQALRTMAPKVRATIGDAATGRTVRPVSRNDFLAMLAQKEQVERDRVRALTIADLVYRPRAERQVIKWRALAEPFQDGSTENSVEDWSARALQGLAAAQLAEIGADGLAYLEIEQVDAFVQANAASRPERRAPLEWVAAHAHAVVAFTQQADPAWLAAARDDAADEFTTTRFRSEDRHLMTMLPSAVGAVVAETVTGNSFIEQTYRWSKLRQVTGFVRALTAAHDLPTTYAALVQHPVRAYDLANPAAWAARAIT